MVSSFPEISQVNAADNDQLYAWWFGLPNPVDGEDFHRWHRICDRISELGLDQGRKCIHGSPHSLCHDCKGPLL